MKKLSSYFKTLLVLAGLMAGVNAWAAGYTRTLTADLEVAGYKSGTLYDFQNNNPAVLPTSGDLRYRDGGIWGLHNFGSGGRSATVSIPVSNGNLLVLQDYAGNTTISVGTKNETLSSSTGYLCFDITSDATEFTVTCPRYGGVVAALVMEKDNSAETADYTIKYILNEETVKTTTGNVAVGSSVNTDASFFVDDVKYIRVDGEAESLTIASGENVLNVNVRLAATYSYSLVSNLGATLATGTGFEGESVVAGYPRYQLVDSKFYEAAVTNKEYRKTITLSEDKVSVTVDYTQKDNNVVFYQEAEAMEGMTVSTKDNIPVRASAAVAAVSSEDVAIITLPAGKYIIHAGIFTSKSKYQDEGGTAYSVNFGVGSETFEAAFTAVNLNEVASAEYDLSESTAISYLGTTSWADAQFDYIWIEKTGVHFASMSIVGDFSENGWEPAQGIAMTQDAENPAIWTVVVEDFAITSEKWNYEYKAVANGNWSDYVLGKADGSNQNYNFNYEGAGEGTYTLTFTVNTTDNTVELAIEKQGQPQPEVAYTVAGSNETMFGKAWDTTATANDLTKNEDGTYSITYEGVELSGDVEYKVAKNHAWTEAWPKDNRVIGISMPGKYDVTIHFDPATGTVWETMAVYKEITDAGYATYCSPYSLNFVGSGVQAFFAKNDQNDGKLHFYEIFNAPFATGLLLKAPAGTYKLKMEAVEGDAAANVGGNKLIGVTAEEKAPAGSFVLLNGEKGIGFYKANNEFTVGANTAYIAATATAREFIALGDETTGIKTVATTKANGEIFNLNGQRVVKAQKGLYIINGKKVMVK